MADATTEFFEALEARGHEPALKKASGSMRFDLTDNGRKTRWLVEIDHGDIAVSHRNAKADCVIRADKSLFEDIATGKANAVAAVLRDELVIDGNPELVVLFQRMFPGTPGTAA
jgi:putative sterol carrier protein